MLSGMTLQPPGAYGPAQPYAPPVPPPSPAGRWQPHRIDPLPGTQYGLVQLRVEPLTSGLAISSLIAGIGSIVVSLVVVCGGLSGAHAGWGAWFAGAFALLSVLAGGGAVVVGAIARRQIRRSGQPGQVRFTGRGVAIAGTVCGSVGVGMSLLGLVLAFVAGLASS